MSYFSVRSKRSGASFVSVYGGACYTLFMGHTQWIEAVNARGWGGAVRTALDVLEPLGVIGAQMLIIAQPAWNAITPIHWRGALGDLAHALENPDALERLRESLGESTPHDAGQ